MAVRTCRMLKNDPDYNGRACFNCGQPAHYWSQDGLKGGRARGDIVFHCQACRKDGRRMAGSVDARINLRGRQETIRREERSGRGRGIGILGGLAGLFRG